jgi:hypothetical protein
VRSLVDFRSQLGVLMEWGFSYFTWQRNSRVILEVPAQPSTLGKPSVIGQAVRVDPWTLNGRAPPPAAGPALPVASAESTPLRVIRS